MSGNEYFFINPASPTDADYQAFGTSTVATTKVSTDIFTESKNQKKKTTTTTKSNNSQKNGTATSSKSSKKPNTTKSGSKKAATTKSAPKTKAERLHSDWQAVMEVGAQTKHENFKCDPKISKAFFSSITDTAKRLNCNADDLAAIMFIESHFDPKAKNGSYRGLIQIDKMSFDSIPDTKCTYSQYCALPREKQIKYVEKYLKMRIDEQGLKGFLSGGQLYTLVRKPKYVRTRSVVTENQKLVTDARKVPAKIKKEKEELEKKTKANSKSNSNTNSNTKPKKLNIKS